MAKKKIGGGGVFDFVWILIAISKPCQGTYSYQAQVQSNQSSFILKDFSHSDKRRFRMQMTPDTWMWHLVPTVSYAAVGLGPLT